MWLGSHWHVASPDENSPILIRSKSLAVNQLFLQLLKRIVVQSELPLEGPIGHAAPLAQQGDHLIHHRDKVHPVSSLHGARPTYSWTSSS